MKEGEEAVVGLSALLEAWAQLTGEAEAVLVELKY